MKPLILLLAGALALAGQTSTDPVVVSIDGKDWTKSEFEKVIRNLPPDLRRNYDANKQVWLEQYALMIRLSNEARKEGLDQREPYKQQIDYSMITFLAESFVGEKARAPQISSADRKNWFERNKAQYKRAKVRDILVTWGQIPKNGEKSRTDTEAAAIVEKVVKRFQAGESFTALVKEFSEDVNSKDKGGELPPIKPEDTQTNSSVKAAVFSLKPGEISKAVRMPGGIYVFQLIDLVEPTEQDLNDVIITQIGREQSIQWIEKERSAMKLEIKDPAYFGLQGKK